MGWFMQPTSGWPGGAGSVFASQCAYLVTGSGVIWAMVLLGERFQPVVWLALAVMLAGVALVQPRPARGATFGLAVPAEAAPWVAIAIMVVMFVLFVLERTPVEVTAIGGVAAMLILGILPVGEAVSVLSNPAPWTIALMFLVMGGLVRQTARWR